MDGQFQSLEEFSDYFVKVLRPLLDVVVEKEIPFLKKSDIYERRVTETERLQDLMRMANNPAISMLKQYIIKMAYCEPYWDTGAQEYADDRKYEYPFQAEEPNCFTEALRRKGCLLSFSHKRFSSEKFDCKIDGVDTQIENIVELCRLLVCYLAENRYDIRYILEHYPFKQRVLLAEVDGKCYAHEALTQNGLEIEDYRVIIDAIPRLLEDLESGRKSDLWDKLREDIFEMRLHVSGRRIFRLFFYREKQLCFLNGFIKKTQTTPKDEIEKALRIRKSNGKVAGKPL